MAADLNGLLQLGKDVLIVPVAELPEESRNQIDFEPGDFAVSRLQSRSGSKIIGAEAADVLRRFREPRTVVEAVILFGRDRNIDPEQVLGDAYPFLKGMVEAGFLVRAPGEGTGGTNGAARASVTWGAGTQLSHAVVQRTFQVFDESEVLLLARSDGRHSVLKVERRTSDGAPIGSARVRLEQEAATLRSLNGAFGPAVLALGEVSGRYCLELEYIAGADAATAAQEWRQREGGRARLLSLVQAIARAYAGLHARGVVHGDVHPRNVLVMADNQVRLIDFGMAVSLHALPTGAQHVERGGVPFFFEPELALAFLSGTPPPPATPAGEQHALATLVYLLVTGAYWQDFRLGRQAMLEDIASRLPLPFVNRSMRPWPALEAVLGRALAKSPAERYPSMEEFASALEGVPPPEAEPAAVAADVQRLVDEAVARAALDGPWIQGTLSPAPATSINYGSAGIALGLLHIARQRRDGEVLALAELWSMRALRELGDGDTAFYNAEIQITREQVGQGSPYHSPSGVHAVASLIGTAKGDTMATAQALAAYLEAARSSLVGLDLTLGQSSVLLGSAILLDAMLPNRQLDLTALRDFGNAALQCIWNALDTMPALAQANIEYLGIAHGWAGFAYATLQWCRVAGHPVPQRLEQRLDELAALALPHGRGLEWPWLLNRPGEPMTMAGWCNGTCGYVFLWTLAHRVLGRMRYLDLAHSAALRTWDAEDPAETLCCGLAGRGYALLNIYRTTGDAVWADRARDLVRRAMRGAQAEDEFAHSLYKGRFGLAVLAAELDHPDEASMPLFEPAGYATAVG